MSISISETSTWYGPTPLSTYSGETVGFRFDVHVDDPSQYDQIEGSVSIHDGTSQQLVAEITAMLPAAAVISMHMAWDGRGPNGPVPPGDYAPTFSARAGGSETRKEACTGITVLPPQGRPKSGSCQRDPCRQRWTCVKEPNDPTLVSGPDTPLPTGDAFVALPQGRPGLSVPTVAMS